MSPRKAKRPSRGVLAVTREAAARIAGLNNAQLEYLDRANIVTSSVVERGAGGREVQHYDFVDLLALLVAVELRRQGVGIGEVRAVIERLRAGGEPHPLAEGIDMDQVRSRIATAARIGFSSTEE